MFKPAVMPYKLAAPNDALGYLARYDLSLALGLRRHHVEAAQHFVYAFVTCHGICSSPVYLL